MARNGLGFVVRFSLGVMLTSLLLIGTPREASAGSIIYVRQGATGLNNGTSWQDAYVDLQSALTAAQSGDQIWVAQGTYVPTPGSDRSASFHLKSGVGLFGGFIGKETQLDPRNPIAHKSRLSGDIGVPGDVSDNSYHVVISSGVSPATITDGFYIENGNATSCNPSDPFDTSVDCFGAGILNLGGAPTLSRLIIQLNQANEEGGGMYSADTAPGIPSLTDVKFISNNGGDGGGGLAAGASSPSLTRVVFSTNRAAGGGGMELWAGSAPLLRDVTFAGNRALGGNGGGMVVETNATPSIEDTTFNNNFADMNGGGLFNYASTPILTNATFHGNEAGQHGGAIMNHQSNPLFKNITVSGNTADADGGGMYNEFGSDPAAENSIFWGDNTEIAGDASSPSTLTDTIVQSGCPANSTCTNVTNGDPVLGKLQYNGGPTETMALGSGSWAIDAGGVNAPCSAADQRGLARPQGLACDIGAYEVGVMKFYSIGADDGFVVESAAGSGVGGAWDSTGQTLLVGDNATNQQVRGFLSFDTSPLPKGASVVMGRVEALKSDVVGSDPFVSLGGLTLDLTTPYFGSSVVLESADFQDKPKVTNAGGPVTSDVPINSWYLATLSPAGDAAINPAGTTQIRLRFVAPTDDHNDTNIIFIFSGDAAAANRPYLLVYFNPK